MKIKKKILKTVEKTDRIVCNKCGKELGKFESCFSIYDAFGYGSENDGDIVDLDLCNECMLEFCHSCKLDPIREKDY